MPVSKTDAPSSGAAIADKNGHVEQRPREPQKAISTATEVGIGCYLVALGAVALATTPWARSLATSSISRTPGGRARFLGLAFTPTAEFNLIIIVMLMAVLGSIAVMIITFASRSGHRTLDSAYLWWYLTRPFEAAAVGVL
jgi:magnesium-transporting ATPase (P-type)